MILAGAALTVYGVATGEIQVALVIIVPVIVASSTIGILAIGSIIVGMLVGVADLFLNTGKEGPQDDLFNGGRQPEMTKRTGWGGVVLIGPIPIVFGSSKRMTIFIAVIAVLVLVVIVLTLFFYGR